MSDPLLRGGLVHSTPAHYDEPDIQEMESDRLQELLADPKNSWLDDMWDEAFPHEEHMKVLLGLLERVDNAQFRKDENPIGSQARSRALYDLRVARLNLGILVGNKFLTYLKNCAETDVSNRLSPVEEP